MYPAPVLASSYALSVSLLLLNDRLQEQRRTLVLSGVPVDLRVDPEDPPAQCLTQLLDRSLCTRHCDGLYFTGR